MTNEKGLFTVAEDEQTNEEIISVAEEELVMPGGRGFGPLSGAGLGPRAEVGECPYADENKESDDWRISKKPKHFLIFLLKEINRLPKPTSILGNRSMMEKALGQYRKLDSYISQALHADYDDEIDVEKVDKARAVLEKARDEVEDALEGLTNMKKQRKKMRRRGEEEHGLVSEAGTSDFNGFQMVITPFQRAIAGALINGTVAGGRDLEELWDNVKQKYNMSEREELEILQILADMGYPEFKDRLRVGENSDPTRDKDFGEWSTQYYA